MTTLPFTTFGHPEDLINLNKEQRDAIVGAQQAPAGIVTVIGPLGAGKSRFACRAILPFLLDRSQLHQVLATSAENNAVDNLALGFQSLIDGLEEDADHPPRMTVLVKVRTGGTETLRTHFLQIHYALLRLSRTSQSLA